MNEPAYESGFSDATNGLCVRRQEALVSEELKSKGFRNERLRSCRNKSRNLYLSAGAYSTKLDLVGAYQTMRVFRCDRKCGL